MGLTVLPWGCSSLTKADPCFRCQAGDEQGGSSAAAAAAVADQASRALSSHLCCQHRHLAVTASQEEWARTEDQPALKHSQTEQHLPRHLLHLESYPAQLCAARALIHTQQTQSHIAYPQRIYTPETHPPFHKHRDIEDLFLTGNATTSSCGLEQHCGTF